MKRFPLPIHSIAIFLAFFSPAVVAWTPATERAAETITGRLSEVDGVRILHLWGTPHERGFAYGYLLAEDILRLYDGYLRDTFRNKEALDEFDAVARNRLRMMNIPRRYADELRGMLSGIRSRLGDRARIDLLDRAIDYDDLVAINCIPDLGSIACSSFAAWGALTADGGTISGRNLDWHRLRILRGTHLIVANAGGDRDDDEKDRGALGWVNVTWPGFIGCLTGMNAEGVTVSMHDAPGGRPSAPLGFTPRGLALRDAVESARADSVIEDVRKVLSTHLAMVGNIVPISFPSTGKAAAVVFEYDGDLKNGMGLTVRKPDRSTKESGRTLSRSYLACTNHYRRRTAPRGCDRYEKIDVRLAELARQGKQVDLDEAWRILRSVACRPGPHQPLETYHSIVFEPDQRVMHVAFSTQDRPAADNEPIRIDVTRLLKEPMATAQR